MPDETAPAAPRRRTPWGRWLLGALLVLVLAALAWLRWGLDPWLRHQLEGAVHERTGGQYTLAVGSLRTHLWTRSAEVRHLRLRPATATVADTLPQLTARLERLDLRGLGLWALLRGGTVPLDSLTLDSLHVAVARLPRRPVHPAPPFYEQHPLRLGKLAVRHASGRYGPAAHPLAGLARFGLEARDLLLTKAGARDSQRLLGAAAWQVALGPASAALGGHRLALGGIRFATPSGRLDLDSLRVVPVPGAGKPGAARVWLQVPRAALRGLQAARWQHQHRFRADSARLTGAQLAFRPPAQAPPPLWQLLRPLADCAELGRLVLQDGYFAVLGVQEQPAVRHIYASAQAVRVDSAAALAGAGRVVYARAWAGHTGRLTARLTPPVYPTSAGHLDVDTRAGTLRLTDLHLRPTLTAAQLNRRSGYQLAQVGLHLPALRASGVDFPLLSLNSHVRAGAVVAERPVLRISSDGRGPLNPNRSDVTPEALGRLRLHLDVRRVEVRGGTIVSSYRSPRSPLVGVFTLDQLHVTLHNVSNDPRRMSRRTPLRGEATGLLQNRCPAHLWFTASTLDPQGRQHLWGSLGAAPLSIVNRMSRPTRLLMFEGQLHRLSLDAHLDKRRITGQVRGTYSGLKFRFSKYKQGEVRKTLLTRVANGVVNGLVIRDQNPRPGGRFVVGDVDLHRELRFSVFTAWKAALLDGMLRSAGVPAGLARKASEASDHGALPPR